MAIMSMLTSAGVVDLGGSALHRAVRMGREASVQGSAALYCVHTRTRLPAAAATAVPPAGNPRPTSTFAFLSVDPRGSAPSRAAAPPPRGSRGCLSMLGRSRCRSFGSSFCGPLEAEACC